MVCGHWHFPLKGLRVVDRRLHKERENWRVPGDHDSPGRVFGIIGRSRGLTPVRTYCDLGPGSDAGRLSSAAGASPNILNIAPRICAELGCPIRIVGLPASAVCGTRMLGRHKAFGVNTGTAGLPHPADILHAVSSFTWERPSTAHMRLTAMVCKSVWAVSNSHCAREVTASNDTYP
jgi:hypothetical protein